MSIDIGRALKAPFSANSWFLKVVLGGIFLCIPIVNFIVLGYFIRTFQKTVQGDSCLPEFDNMGKLFSLGARFVGAMIILALPFYLLGVVIYLALTMSVSYSDVRQLVTILGYLNIVYNLISVVIGVVTLFMTCCFASDEKVLSIIDFQRARLLFKDNTKGVITLLISVIAVNIIYMVIIFVCCITIIGALLAPALIYSLTITLYNLLAQFTRTAVHSDEFFALANK